VRLVGTSSCVILFGTIQADKTAKIYVKISFKISSFVIYAKSFPEISSFTKPSFVIYLVSSSKSNLPYNHKTQQRLKEIEHRYFHETGQQLGSALDQNT
jgi:hypothetical protein